MHSSKPSKGRDLLKAEISFWQINSLIQIYYLWLYSSILAVDIGIGQIAKYIATENNKKNHPQLQKQW